MPLSKKWTWVIIGSVIGVSVIVAVTLVLVLVVFKPKAVVPSTVPNVDCVVKFDETKWSACDAECGGEGQQTNTSGVIVVEPSGDGHPCGTLTTTRTCSSKCPRSLYFKKGFSFGTLAPTLFQGPFTVGMWVMLETAPSLGGLSNILRCAGTSSDMRIVNPNMDTIMATGHAFDTDPPMYATGDANSLTRPTCLVYRWQPSSSTMNLFVNNKMYTSVALTNDINNTPSFNVLDNSGTDNSAFQPRGRVQEFRVWQTNLSDSEITTFYNRGQVTRQPIRLSANVAVFHLNEGVGSEIINDITKEKLSFDSTKILWDDTDKFGPQTIGDIAADIWK